ncbi:hypothetical protein ACH4LQ_14310 [Streptomyces globisporus]|uniref:hypothetical protein n=1 Tax=Streptomyces globisporus TaxID=1908 RepID=UPI0019877294|nr:hypothetical protein GCM10010264_22120 [Streptomyces globisporus]
MSGRYGSHEGDIATYRELDRLSEWLHGVGHAGSCDFVKSSPVPQVEMNHQAPDYLRDPVRYVLTVTTPGFWSPSSRNA